MNSLWPKAFQRYLSSHMCDVGWKRAKDIARQLNRLLFRFLWNGTDKITRVAAINKYEQGGLRMIDLDSMVVSLRLSWMKRIFSDCGGTWKSYLIHNLERFGGLFSCSTVDMTFTIIHPSLLLTASSWGGGHNSEILLQQCMTGSISFETTIERNTVLKISLFNY